MSFKNEMLSISCETSIAMYLNHMTSASTTSDDAMTINL